MIMRNLILLLTISLVLFSWAKDKSKSDSSSSSTGLEGTWITTCYLSDNNSSFWKYEKDTLTVSGSNLEDKLEYFSDVNCTSNTMTMRYVFTELTIGDEITIQVDIKVINIL